MSIETVLKNLSSDLKANTGVNASLVTALNRFCDLCEKHGINLAAPQVSDSASQVTETALQVNDEPTANASVVSETEADAPADSIEAGVWIPQEEEREEDSAVAEAPAVETPAKLVTVSAVADSMKKLLPNRNAIVAVLDQFGVGKITELKAEDLAKAKQLFDQALQGV